MARTFLKIAYIVEFGGFVISISKEPAAAIDAARAAVEQIRGKRRREQEEQDGADPSA